MTLRACLLGLLVAASFAAAETATPPKVWIDPATGHRVVRLTDEPGSDSFYFNINPFTPDGKEMVYTSPSGVHVLSLDNLRTRRVLAHVGRAIVVGARTPTLYYSLAAKEPGARPSLWAVNLDTGAARKIADLPRRASVVTINADETLAAGTFIEGDADAGGAYDGTPRMAASRMSNVNLGEPANKGEMMARRLAAKLPMTLFTLNLRTGEIRPLIQHSTDWLNHLQFSPTDPTLLMYCHEGIWQRVNRIWTIRTDGSRNQLIHKRIMKMEIAGHEWWAADGRTLWYQLSLPRNVPDATYLASYDCATGGRTWYHFDHEASSIHHNSAPDQRLFCGDGNPGNPWIVLCRPHLVRDDHTLGENLINGGWLEVERLVGMAKQNYRLEPNPIFTPDRKWIIFRANFFGPDYAFAVEVEKGGPASLPEGL